MKRKTKLLILIFFILAVMLSAFYANSYAAEQKTIYAKGLRDDNFSYAFMDENNVFQRILKLYEVDNDKVDFLIYCARGGLGFGDSVSEIKELDYEKIADLRNESAVALNKYEEAFGVDLDREITNFTIQYNFNKNIFNESSNNEKERYENLKTFLEKKLPDITYTTNKENNSLEFGENSEEIEITVTYNNINIYSAILNLLDNMYLMENSGNYIANDYKEIFLTKAGLKKQANLITNAQIDVVQQLALWFFTNYGELGPTKVFSISPGYEKLYYTSREIRDVFKLTDLPDLTNIPDGSGLQSSLRVLYKYLISTAIQKSYDEETQEIIEPEISIEGENIDITKSGAWYNIGPFEIISNEGKNVEYTINEVVLKDAKGVIIPKQQGTETTPIPIYYIYLEKDRTQLESLQEAINKGDINIQINELFAKGFDLSNISLYISYSYKNVTTDSSLWIQKDDIAITDGTAKKQPVIILKKDLLKKDLEETLDTKKITGKFDLNLLKVDAADKTKKLTGAKFKITNNDRQNISLTDNKDGTFSINNVEITSKDDIFTYIIIEDEAPEGYLGLQEPFTIEITVKEEDGKYVINTAILKSTVNGVTVKISEDKTSIELTVENEEIKEFDLALRKFITKVGENSYQREPNVDTSTLINGTFVRDSKNEKTATYIHTKAPITVQKEDIITYTIRVYNEGDIDGYATLIEDYLPEELEFVPYTEGDGTINDTYNWEISTDGRTVTTNYLKDKKIDKFSGGETLDFEDIQIQCKVKSTSETGKILTNIAQINGDKNESDTPDRDSEVNNVEKPQDTNLPSYDDNQEDEDDFEKVIVETKPFDLALRKYITALERAGENVEIENRRELNDIDAESIATIGTATYKHRKDPVFVEPNDIVTYTFRVYNENETTGQVTSITDYLPEGLELYTEGLTKVESQDVNIESWSKLIENETDIESGLWWKYIYTFNKTTRELKIECVSSPVINKTLFYLLPFDKTHENETAKGVGSTGWINGLNYGELSIKFKVTKSAADENQILTNIATMTYNSVGSTEINDFDSKPLGIVGNNFNLPSSLNTTDIGYTNGNYELEDLEENIYFVGQEDDDDFEKICIKGIDFDLSLRKFITKVNNKDLDISRIPSIDLTTLNEGTTNEKGKKEYTATYTHPKDAVIVHKGDLVKYTIRVYNEGEVDGYATKIADYLPEGLGLLVEYNNNINNYWSVNEAKVSALIGENSAFKKAKDLANLKLEDFTGITSLEGVNVATGKITSTLLNNEKILAYDKTKTSGDDGWQKATTGDCGLYYKDIEVTCIVLAENTFKGQLVNMAEISEDKAVDNKDKEINVSDRDSTPENINKENYVIKEKNSTYQEDDDDFEPLSLKYFDLALRKFITKVNDKAPEISREPVVDVSPLVNGSDTTALYEHTKEPLYVANGDEVEYTIRVYNEGTLDGYAYEIADDIPEGLVFDPKNETNIKYGWKMYKVVDKDETKYDLTYNDKKYIETDDASEATMIRTRYLELYLMKAFNATTKVINSGEVKVVFTIDENYTDTTRIIKNEAQITEDSGDDEDSETNKWQEEDDEDIEYVHVQYFDLSLLKWVTKSIVTVDDVTTTTETGFKPNTGLTETTGIRENDEAEPIAKVEVHRKKINSTIVKFVYKIRVTNEGDLAGYATEITDYIPKGLEFYGEDNKAFGWIETGDGKVTTRALETVLLQPNESAELEIVFRWINDDDNLGLKTNIAEISEDYSINDDKSPDIDSNPEYIDIDNYIKEQEDDDDFALVILSVSTGGKDILAYTTLISGAIAIIAGGIILIKKYVLV